MNSQEIAKQIAEKLSSSSSSLGVFGLRKTFNLNIGDGVPNSFDWDYENDCCSDTELDGASVIGLPEVYDTDEIDEVLMIVEKMQQYPGNKLFLIYGDHAGFGADKGEMLISRGVVLMAWEL